MSFDVAIIETGNGGDVQLNGNDLAIVKGIENMPYLGMFGGNVEAVTKNKVVDAQSFDWWANSLFMLSNQSIQLNSTVEKTLNSVALNSAGRVLIENAIKEDLKFLSDQGVTVQVDVIIYSVDRINVKLRISQLDGTQKVTTINFKKSLDGDFFILDFNDDFYL